MKISDRKGVRAEETLTMVHPSFRLHVSTATTEWNLIAISAAFESQFLCIPDLRFMLSTIVAIIWLQFDQ